MKIWRKSDPFPIVCCYMIITDNRVTLKIKNPKRGEPLYMRVPLDDVAEIQTDKSPNGGGGNVWRN